MKKSFVFILCLALFVNACSDESPTPVIIIVPDKCQIGAGEDFSISLEGSNLPASSEIKWSATKGGVSPSTGVSVIYTAPQQEGSVIITAVLETANGNYSKTLVCEIVASNPTVENPTDAPVQPPPTDSPSGDMTTIAITEVMAAPCDGVLGPGKNEYVELYNYGDTSIDVNGWWLAVGQGGDGTPDKIATWDSVVPGVSLGSHVITNSSVISPNTYAVILTPRYYTGSGKDLMPYKFPAGTIILSLANSNYLGNDSTGLLGNSKPISVLVLYTGLETIMENVISTYGTPTYGSSPQSVYDNESDNFPYPVADCKSMERIVASGQDLISNWREVAEGNPGEGSYP